jgi:Flp pilus assembly protein TadG
VERLVQALRRDEEGAIAIIVALFAIVLFGFAALVVDVGNASDVRGQASAAADDGALAGERALASWTNANRTSPDPAFEQTLVDTVKAAVADTYEVDDSAWSSCTDTVPSGFTATAASQCVQYQVTIVNDPATGLSEVTGSSVRVRIPPRDVPSTFGGIFGASSISVSPVAAANAGQDPPSPCLPCDPRLDDASGQPASQATLPDSVRNFLPDPSTVAAAPPLDANGCPTGPGRFDADVDVTMPDNVTPCVLPPGLYVFNNSALSVTGFLQGTGVTLVFYGTSDQPIDVSGRLRLAAPPAHQPPALGDPIPGVAIVIDQYDTSIQQPRTFEMGADFDITGSVYALDGHATWKTKDGDCQPSGGCVIHDDGVDERIAVTATTFGDGGRIPTVASDHLTQLPPPQPEHLSE